MTPRMDLTGIILIMALGFNGTSLTTMRTHVMCTGMGSHALLIMMSSDLV